jgi:hypothetical protein
MDKVNLPSLPSRNGFLHVDKTFWSLAVSYLALLFNLSDQRSPTALRSRPKSCYVSPLYVFFRSFESKVTFFRLTERSMLSLHQ